MDRTILHCDLNNFYASVECLFQPHLKDVPMAVCGNAKERRGIILAKNEIAKSYGIVTAETVWQAQKKCPDLVLITPQHDKYGEYSKIVREIFSRYTDMIEPFGIDEAWLDVTGSLNLFGSGKQIADKIRETIKSEVGLTASVGVSFNKIFAKLGSDYKKPDATTVINRENFKQIVYPLPVSALLYVGKVATKTLLENKIRTIGQLASYDKNFLNSILGKMGTTIHEYANGIDDSPVHFSDEKRELKSIGKGNTFGHNLLGQTEIKAGLLPLAENVATRLRKHNLKCSTLQVTIRDPEFKTITRQKKLDVPTHLMTEILKAANEIMKSNWDMEKPIRMLTITGQNLIPETASQQLNFFETEKDEKREKLEKIEQTIDDIRSKYGKSIVSLGANISSKSVDVEDEDE